MPYATPAELFDAVVNSRNHVDLAIYLEQKPVGIRTRDVSVNATIPASQFHF
jgi:hypothetical protein